MVVVGRQATDEFQDGAARLKENREEAMTSTFRSIAKTESGRLLEDEESASDSRGGKPWDWLRVYVGANGRERGLVPNTSVVEQVGPSSRRVPNQTPA